MVHLQEKIKIEKNHPQHFDEFFAIFVCCKILAKRDSERI
jgi:hypothetical protein